MTGYEYLASLGRPVSAGKAPFVIVPSLSETWSTERLEHYVEKLHAFVADGVDPAFVAPHINSANAILDERGARRPRGETKRVGKDSACGS